MHRYGTCLLLGAVAMAACGGDQADGWQGTITDSAGVQVVTTTSGGQWSAQVAWRVEEQLRIGQEGDPDYQFGNVVAVDVDSNGHIYVMDQLAREVRVYNQDGQFVRRIGQPGNGPGEFSEAAGPVFLAVGDTVVVPDIGLQRINRFTSQGDPVESVPLPMSEGIPARWMQAPDHDIIQQAMIMPMPNQPNVEPANLLLRRAPTGELRDTVMEMPVGQTVDFSSGQPRITLFAPEPVWAIHNDGRIFYGVNSSYEFQVFNSAGDLVRVVRKDAARRPVADSDKEDFRRLIQEAWERAGMPPEAVSMMSQSIQFADHYPAYMNIMGGPEGTIWVQGVQTPEEVRETGTTFNLQDAGGRTWEVFDGEGRLLGTVDMPARFTPLTFVEDVIYGVTLDELDVQYVTRGKLEQPDPVAG